jgi:hypothetical protein
MRVLQQTGVSGDSLFQKTDPAAYILRCVFSKKILTLKIGFESTGIYAMLPFKRLSFLRSNNSRTSRAIAWAISEAWQVHLQIAIIGFSPEMVIGRPMNQLSTDAHPLLCD